MSNKENAINQMAIIIGNYFAIYFVNLI